MSLALTALGLILERLNCAFVIALRGLMNENEAWVRDRSQAGCDDDLFS
jgi:hypothetical protein